MDYLSQAQGRVILQYRESPKLLAFIAALMAPVQEVENVLAGVPLLDDPGGASGVNLDVTGDLVGQPRVVGGVSFDDVTYRLLIRARLARNATHGTGPEIVAMLAFLFDTQIRFQDQGGMGLTFAMGRAPTATEVVLLRSGLIPVPMGVELSGEWYDVTNFFGFADQAGALGFGENNLAGPPGGRHAELF